MSFFEDSADEPPRKRSHAERQSSVQGQSSGRSSQNRVRGCETESDDEDAAPVFSRDASGRVGLRLLQQMQKSTPQVGSSSSVSTGVSNTGKLLVVEDYVPLSVGGFMETSTESAANNLDNIKPGDIMCLRCPSDFRAEPNGNVKCSKVSSSTSCGTTAGINFVKETELTAEERQYGRRLTCEMMNEMFEVSRLDRATNSLEAVFLDGTRKKLKTYAVRPAGFVESDLYKRWKADESSRPVRVVYAAQKLQVTESSGANSGSSRDVDGKTAASAVQSAVWWVVPQLIVRLVEESAGDLFGKKFVVKSIARKDGKIRLEPLRVPDVTVYKDTRDHALPNRGTEHSAVDVFGCAALETVIPRLGEQGLIVQGPMRGELVVVTSRVRSPNGGLEEVKVRSTLTEEEFSVEPHMLCMMVTQR
ncbi:uncharacterized protein TEOVI_000488400 [Trypanosoma equiperdum]|uniref:Uncharacterized protein n=1 Tax=Trypanosoma equiperdum TaxID=5694 RepID=A0A1G4I3E7_TRYEQ|nr:hypothetical protein, conserved [Trypanosoma equiperdum]